MLDIIVIILQVCLKLGWLIDWIVLNLIVSIGKQLSRKARAITSSIAKVRIHVERAIERLKNFRIFQGNLPLSMVGIANQLVIVWAAICNLLPPLAKN